MERKLAKNEDQNSVLSNAFMWLFIGLLICFGVSYASSYSEEMFYLIYGSLGGYGYLIFAIVEIIVAIVLVLRITKLSPLTAKILYILYSILTGLSFTGLIYFYTGSSLAFVFLITALIFGAFALIGHFTKIDLSKWYIYFSVALFAIIILMIVNRFLMNNTLDIFLCIVSIVVFCFYTAYDVQKAVDKTFLGDCENKGIYIAFQLFLDFINLFLDLLRLFGKSRD